MNRLTLIAIALTLLASPAASASVVHPGAAGASRAPCSNAVGERAARNSGFAARAENYWSKRFGSVEFSVSRSVCGHLAGRGRDMVVVMLLDGGTGGSPKPWAIFNRTRRGRLHLSYADVGRHLICPQSVGIHHRRLTIYRPSEYLGAYTLCDRIARYRWKHRRYVLTGVHNAYTTCRSPLVAAPPGPGYGLIIERMRAASVSCNAAARLAARNVYGRSTGGWSCAEILGGEQRCFHRRNWRKWFTYFFGGDAG